MKMAGRTNIKSTRKWAIPAGVMALGALTVIAAGAGPGNSRTSDSTAVTHSPEPQATEVPAPDASPEITINGVAIPTNISGSNEVAIPGGTAQVEVSNGKVEVQAESSATNGDTSSTSNGNVDIKIDSHSTSTSTSNRSTTKYSNHTTTSTFNSGNSDVTITH